MSERKQTPITQFLNTQSQDTHCVTEDRGTSRSRPVHRTPRGKKTLHQSLSPSPSTKRKSKLLGLQEPDIKRRNIEMEGKSSIKNLENEKKKAKLTPEFEELRNDLRSSVELSITKLIAPLQDSINALLQIKTAWEESIKECNQVKKENLELNRHITKIEKENQRLNTRINELENKQLEACVAIVSRTSNSRLIK